MSFLHFLLTFVVCQMNFITYMHAQTDTCLLSLSPFF